MALSSTFFESFVVYDPCSVNMARELFGSALLIILLVAILSAQRWMFTMYRSPQQATEWMYIDQYQLTWPTVYTICVSALTKLNQTKQPVSVLSSSLRLQYHRACWWNDCKNPLVVRQCPHVAQIDPSSRLWVAPILVITQSHFRRIKRLINTIHTS